MKLLEINKLIAEAKGIKWQEKEVQGAEDAVFSTKDDYSFKIHNWASNIKDAWELFEEMPIGSSIYRTSGENAWSCWLNRSGSESVGMACKTAPLAICGTWLYWKSQQDKPALVFNGNGDTYFGPGFGSSTNE